jgi:hypothetical protein
MSSSVDVKDISVGGNLFLKGVAVVNPNSTNKVKIGTIAPGVIVAPKAPINEVTLLFPKRVHDGQVMFLSFTQDIRKILYTNAKFAHGSKLDSVKAGDSIMIFYHAQTDKWYKLSGGRG